MLLISSRFMMWYVLQEAGEYYARDVALPPILLFAIVSALLPSIQPSLNCFLNGSSLQPAMNPRISMLILSMNAGKK